ncbi:MAG: LPXTG cell wall anchor domain-containing protein [Microbacteriaceae bacterium]
MGSGGLQSGYNESPLVITGSSLPDTGLDATLVTIIALGCFATGVVILMRRRRRA